MRALSHRHDDIALILGVILVRLVKLSGKVLSDQAALPLDLAPAVELSRYPSLHD